jgi:replication factor A2
MPNIIGYDNQGGFGSQGTPSGESKVRRNYDEQTLIPVTIKQILTADGDPSGGNDISLKDGRTLYMVKLVGCVRSHEQKSTNLTIQIEDGTGLIDVKTWMNEGDDCSAIANMRQECCEDYAFVKVIGQVKEFDGRRHVQANDIRLLGTKNEITYHLLEVAHSFDKYEKRKASGMGVGMGYGIGNMSSMPKTMGAGVSMNGGMNGGAGGVQQDTMDAIKNIGGKFW